MVTMTVVEVVPRAHDSVTVAGDTSSGDDTVNTRGTTSSSPPAIPTTIIAEFSPLASPTAVALMVTEAMEAGARALPAFPVVMKLTHGTDTVTNQPYGGRTPAIVEGDDSYG